MKRDIGLYIEDIIENIYLIENSLKKTAKSEFKSNRLLIDATLRRLEIIGEAAKNVPISFRKKYPQIPWKDMAGFRDKLSHAYFGIKIDMVWNIIKEDFPTLKKDIEKIKI